MTNPLDDPFRVELTGRDGHVRLVQAGRAGWVCGTRFEGPEALVQMSGDAPRMARGSGARRPVFDTVIIRRVDFAYSVSGGADG